MWDLSDPEVYGWPRQIAAHPDGYYLVCTTTTPSRPWSPTAPRSRP
ncbi:MAG: hypothetical protein IPI35_30370 [Deltaproteobacteria bacterium]|nr:hypothetical protein [Deltaproteobacteria bacterium]